MQGLNEDEERQVLGEILADKLSVIEEYLQSILGIQNDIPLIKEAIRSIEDRLSVFEHIVKQHDKELKVHSRDIKYLKTKVA